MRRSHRRLKQSSLLNGLPHPHFVRPRNDKNLPRPSLTKGGSRKVAFTLAETLITLGIIGVVAALTLPNLIAKYDEMVTLNKIKRSYSEIINAMEMSKQEIGSSD